MIDIIPVKASLEKLRGFNREINTEAVNQTQIRILNLYSNRYKTQFQQLPTLTNSYDSY
jgi:hypothetical protein